MSANNSLVLGGTGADAVNVGIGTTAPASTLDVRGSVAYSFVTTSTASITLNGTHHTIRRLAACPTINLPDATTASGREYVIISPDAAASSYSLVTFSSSQSVYNVDDTVIGNNTPGNMLAPRGPIAFTIQSDGANWYVTKR